MKQLTVSLIALLLTLGGCGPTQSPARHPGEGQSQPAPSMVRTSGNVPEVRGLSVAGAAARLSASGFQPATDDDFALDSEEGVVVAQEPSHEALLFPGEVVGLRVCPLDARQPCEARSLLAGQPERSNQAPLVCTASAVQRTVADLFLSVNDGNLALMDVLIAQPPAFQWLSVGPPGADGTGLLAESSDRPTVVQYLMGRSEHGERILMTSFRYNGYDARRNLAHFAVEVRRKATDLPPDAEVRPGKGAIDCVSGTIAVLSF